MHPTVPLSLHPSGLSQVLSSPELESQSRELKSESDQQTIFEFIIELEPAE